MKKGKDKKVVQETSDNDESQDSIQLEPEIGWESALEEREAALKERKAALKELKSRIGGKAALKELGVSMENKTMEEIEECRIAYLYRIAAETPLYNPLESPSPDKSKTLNINPLVRNSVGSREEKRFRVIIRSQKRQFVSPVPKGPRRSGRVKREDKWGSGECRRSINQDQLKLVTGRRTTVSEFLDKWYSSPEIMRQKDFSKLYRFFSKEKPLSVTSVNQVEGHCEFKAVLFVPLQNNFGSAVSSFHLYIKRLPCTIQVDNMLPEYLSFVKVIINFDILPITEVNLRKTLDFVKTELTRKALAMFSRISRTCVDKYQKFWTEFGNSIKLGIVEDPSNRSDISELLRFQSSRSNGELVSLDQYVNNMKTDQNVIEVMNKEHLDKSGFAEYLKNKNSEVIFIADQLDECVFRYLPNYKYYTFQNVFNECAKVGKVKENELEDRFNNLTNWLKDALVTENIDSVKLSNCSANNPCAIVACSANVDTVSQSRTSSDAGKHAYIAGKRVLEINLRHPIIKELQERVAKDPEDASARKTLCLLCQTALMEGRLLTDPRDFASNIYSSIGASLGLSPESRCLD